MQRIAIKMKLSHGAAAEFQKRHDKIWPELRTLLLDAGIIDYSIYHDDETHILFGVLCITDRQAFDCLPSHPLMQKWWDYMADIVETHPDNSPVSNELAEVFYL